jgi:hypothetical protein
MGGLVVVFDGDQVDLKSNGYNTRDFFEKIKKGRKHSGKIVTQS